MIINRSSFFLAMGGLAAAGGVGGYVVADQGLLKSPPPLGATEQQAAPPLATVEPTPVAESVPPAPVCDDMVGAPAACPPPGYSSDEGEGCGALPSKRCEDFKQTMKPRVAERAVACLNALTPAQRCDQGRLSLCANLALMSACPEPDAPVRPSPGGATVATDLDEVGARCQSVTAGCGNAAFAPSAQECRAEVAGLTSLGRDQVASCMKTHCADKGLIGCAGIVDAK